MKTLFSIALGSSLLFTCALHAAELTEGERAVLGDYVENTYSCFNAYLRKGPEGISEGCYDIQEEKVIQERIQVLKAALDKLPTFKGETWRGTCIPNDAAAKMKVQGVYRDKAFMSTSKERKVSEGFLGTPMHCAFGMLKIKGRTGRDLEQLKNGEEEVIFAPGTRFRITKLNKSERPLAPGIDRMVAYYDLELEEIEVPLVSAMPKSLAGTDLPNAHQVDREGMIFRGMGPAGYEEELLDLGIKEVLVFKNALEFGKVDDVKAEKKVFEALGLPAENLHDVAFRWKKLESAEAACRQTVQGLAVLKAAKARKNRVFFHCTVGEDRTGMLAGLWRMLEEGMVPPQAFAQEMCARGYSDGNAGKPAAVTQAIEGELTPLFLGISRLVREKKLSLENLDEEACVGLKLEPTALTCKNQDGEFF